MNFIPKKDKIFFYILPCFLNFGRPINGNRGDGLNNLYPEFYIQKSESSYIFEYKLKQLFLKLYKLIYMRENIFLTAKWLHLINVTYKVDPGILKLHLPKGLELDTIDEKAFISLVAFDFKDTKVKGMNIPFHVNFPEINLRFYVKYKEQRGVVFIKEFVPKFMISFIANTIYNEPYKTADMESEVTIKDKIEVRHSLKIKKDEYFIKLSAKNQLSTPPVTSYDHFFKEHSFGYGTSHSGKTLVYKVDHPLWMVFPVIEYSHNFDFSKIYGSEFSFLNNEMPFNVLLAEGSEVKVYGAEDLK